jgi:hypothetical protein
MKVFISYSRNDEAAVGALVDDLRRARAQVWMDEELGGGDSWWTEILDQIRSCDVFLFALSDKSVQSKPCRAELGYAQALELPILPVQIGQVTSYYADPIFTVQLVDFRDPTRKSAFDLLASLHERASRRTALPDPLPEPPPIPYEYLLGLSASINDTTTVLPPQIQAQMLFELRTALSDEDDPVVLDEIRKLLRALRKRTDVTYMIASEVDALLRNEPAKTVQAAEGESRVAAVPTATAQAGDPDPVHDPLLADGFPQQPPVPEAPRGGRLRRHRRSILLASVAVALVAAAVITYFVVTRPKNPPQPTVAAAYNCKQVSAPMTSIDPRKDTEPRLRIPHPPGWEQSKMFNPGGDDPVSSPVIRAILINKSLAAKGFAPNAIVTMNSLSGAKVSDAFAAVQKDLTSSGGTDISSTDGTLCGLPAQTVRWTAAAVPGAAPARPAKTVVVADQVQDMVYVISVSVQTTDPDNPTYQKDSDTILTGLQVLPPGATG